MSVAANVVIGYCHHNPSMPPFNVFLAICLAKMPLMLSVVQDIPAYWLSLSHCVIVGTATQTIVLSSGMDPL